MHSKITDCVADAPRSQSASWSEGRREGSEGGASALPGRVRSTTDGGKKGERSSGLERWEVGSLMRSSQGTRYVA